MSTKPLTPRQYLKQNPSKYILVTYEFGEPIFIAPLKNMDIQITLNRNEAEIWSAMDTTPVKLNFHIASTGYKGLTFELVSEQIKPNEHGVLLR